MDVYKRLVLPFHGINAIFDIYIRVVVDRVSNTELTVYSRRKCYICMLRSSYKHKLFHQSIYFTEIVKKKEMSANTIERRYSGFSSGTDIHKTDGVN